MLQAKVHKRYKQLLSNNLVEDLKTFIEKSNVSKQF